MNSKTSFTLSLLLYFLSSSIILSAQISKQEIINEVNFINSKTNAGAEDSQIFQAGHGPNERLGITIDKIQIKDEQPTTAVLTSSWFKYSDNYSKTKIYFKSNTPIYIIKEKKVTLTSADDSDMKEVLTSSTKWYILNWKTWQIEKEIIKDGEQLLENNIDKAEIEKIINDSKKE